MYNRALSAQDITGLYNGGGSASDTTAPSVPTGLTATAVSSSQINLSWNASTDNVGVAGYKLSRGGVQIASVTGTSYQNTGLSPSTTYTYTVAAYDTAGNASAQSAGVSATTAGSTPLAAYYVDTNHPSASDSNQGTETLPWKTIQKAANTLVAGDTVYIKQGTYTGLVSPARSGSAGALITYSAYPGQEHQAIINGSAFEIKGKSYIKVSGLKIQNVPSGVSIGRGIHIIGPGSNITISGNHTYNTFESGIAAWGAPYQQGEPNAAITKLIIENNKVELANNAGWNEMITLANGIDGFEIRNNEVLNGGNDINGGEGIDVKSGTRNGKIYGNRVHDLKRIGIYIDGG
ncbi:MAG: fibronectin type III domain-containing protein, partial [Gammaproteobacteria bacterium]